MPNIAAELVILRNEFYERSYSQIKQIVVILLLITILLIGFCMHQSNILRPMPKYFPTTPDGRLIYSPPINENHLLLSDQTVDQDTGVIIGMPSPTILYEQLKPYGENALIIYWASLAVYDMFDYDFVHYRMVIQDASKYFTPEGHQNFIEALAASKNIETVKARSAVVIPQITGEVQFLGTSMINGHFAWHLKVPVQLTYASASYKTSIVQNLMANMSIGRVSTLVTPFYGVSIYSLNFEEVLNTEGKT
ncbi:MAG TPA: DotI/IcmL/TraM family protein [Gammaproteobacteria bacterium]|nr:DotI/IcmL/TraM family protein [Gammaproteobacteria bacterium]